MDRISKFLRKLSEKDRFVIEELVQSLLNNAPLKGNVRRLKGYPHFYRIRKGQVRIIFTKIGKSVAIVAIDFRREDTYDV
jgi:mRNA-degrading endonuclease RelE of RelBE toxin-antitoxin system